MYFGCVLFIIIISRAVKGIELSLRIAITILFPGQLPRLECVLFTIQSSVILCKIDNV